MNDEEVSSIAKQEAVGQKSDEIELRKAEVILKAVVDANEKLISEDNLNPIAFSSDVVKQALVVYGKHLVSETPYDWFKNVHKETPQGRLQFFMFDQAVGHNPIDDKKGFNPDHISMQLIVNNGVVLDEGIRILDLKYSSAKGLNHYRDTRENREVSEATLTSQFDVDNFRFLWRGLRWMSVNMLSWKTDANATMPEDLSSKSLSSSNPQQLKS